MKRYYLFVIILSLFLNVGNALAQSSVATFTLRDHLQREWQNELVFYPVADNVFGREDLALIGPEDAPVVYQWVDESLSPTGKSSIAFLASIPELGEATYRLVKGKAAGSTDLKVRQSGEAVTIENRRVGISVGGSQAESQGPINSIRLSSGRNIGRGLLDVPQPPESVETKLVAAGPVFAEATVDYQFPDYNFWRLRFRVIAGEPVVLVDEKFQLPAGAKYNLSLADRFSADQIFYRDNNNSCRTVAARSVQGEPLFRIEPWPAWWGERLQSHWLGVMGNSGDLLALGARDPGDWVIPGRTDWDTAISVDHKFDATFQLQGFERRWALIAMSRTEAIIDEQIGQRVTPPAQQYLMKYDDISLDRVKDWTRDWDDRRTQHPRLFTTSADLDRFRKQFKVDPEMLEQLQKSKLYSYKLDDCIAYYLATGDETLGRTLADFALENLQKAVDFYAKQDKLRNQGSCPHHRNPTIFAAAITADLLLKSKTLTPEERAQMKAQLAFLGYTLARPSVISPERGFQANPNMTSMARACLGIVACTIPNHPQAKDWAQLAIDEMEKELTEWCGENGGWLEAPHYMTASIDSLLATAMALQGSGLSDVDWVHHPKFKLALAWLAKIETPPDSRLEGSRCHPAIGNTYLGERTCLAGWAARIWRDEDPQYAREMQWMWRASGSFPSPGIGGAYPGFTGYGRLMLDESIPTSPPRWTSELFPDAGAVFRAHFPSEQETYMYYIQGKMHQHYDFDEGSFVLWGKGQPLCEDFGYYGRAPAADHSRIDDGFYEALGLEGKIQEFAAGDTTDYLRGERSGWHRQILFVKDRDPAGPNYFIVRDAVLSGRNFDWRLWLATDEAPDVKQNPVRMKGRTGVDLVVYFLAPEKPAVTTEKATRTAGTSGWGHSNRTTSQYCLQMKQLASGQPVSVVLYPVMADEPTPRFTSLASGRVVKIDSKSGTDYAILSLERFQFSGDGLELDARAGAVQIRGGSVRASLARRGTISYRGKTVNATTESEKTISR